MTSEELGNVIRIEISGRNLRRHAPPGRGGFAMMETHPSEQARIAEDERASYLAQQKVVVLFGAELCRLHAQRSAHAEMQSEPISAGKTKEHLLATRA